MEAVPHLMLPFPRSLQMYQVDKASSVPQELCTSSSETIPVTGLEFAQ